MHDVRSDMILVGQISDQPDAVHFRLNRSSCQEGRVDPRSANRRHEARRLFGVHEQRSCFAGSPERGQRTTQVRVGHRRKLIHPPRESRSA